MTASFSAMYILIRACRMRFKGPTGFDMESYAETALSRASICRWAVGQMSS